MALPQRKHDYHDGRGFVPKIRGSRYPWDEWFQKEKFTLMQGRDYRYRTGSMAVQAHRAAKRRGLSIAVNVALDGRSFTVTVLGKRTVKG